MVADWVVQLRDGALAIQRNFEFESKIHMAAFLLRAGGITSGVGIQLDLDAEMSGQSVVVTIKFLPDEELLGVAGNMAARYEHHYDLICDAKARTAA